MTLLFAYASNLNREHMGERCPAAEVLDTATLADHRLVFRYGADLEPHSGASAVGVVWRLSPEDMITLDHYEGCPGLYRKDYRQVQLAGGEAVEVMVYRMNRDGYAPPPEDYLEVIREGYRDFGLSEAMLDAAVELSSRLRPVATGQVRRPGLH